MKISALCIFFLIFVVSIQAQADWKLEKSSNGVKVYTRYVSGWGIKEFKAVVEVDCSIADAEAVLRDAKGRKEWMHNTYDTRDLEGSSQNELFSYSAIDAPWPVSDRDNVTKKVFTYPSRQQIVVKMTAAPTHTAAVSGNVRIQKLQGEWRFTDLGNGKTEIIQQCLADAGGNIPDWLANSSVIDSPFYTLLNMKKRIDGIIWSRKMFKK